jgi:hypothetical protein
MQKEMCILASFLGIFVLKGWCILMMVLFMMVLCRTGYPILELMVKGC